MANTNYPREDFINGITFGWTGMALMGSMLSLAEKKHAAGPGNKAEFFKKKHTATGTGDHPLSQLRESYHSELFDRFIPNMDRLVIDHKYGGFMCDIDNLQGTRLTGNKKAWSEGRGIWVYSFLYNHFGEDPAFLEVARKSKDFILKHRPKGKDFWVGSLTREGTPNSGPGDIFGNLYIAEGLAEYAKATDDDSYYLLARKILLDCLARYDREDYRYHPEDKIAGPRILNHWMILLRNSTQMLEMKPDDEISKLSDRCVDAIMKHHLNPDYELLNVTLTHNLEQIPGTEHSQVASFGLGIQSLWMVMFEALRRKDEKLFDKAKHLFKRHVNVAHDAVYGGYYWSLDQVDNFKYKLGKNLSLQDEVLIGTLCLVEKGPDTWAENNFEQTYAYVQEKFIRPEYVFPIESGDRKMMESNKNGMGIYHHPRQLMLNLLSIDRMINCKGPASGILG